MKKIPENVKALTTFKKSPYPYASSARMILRHYQTTGGARKISTHTYAASVLKKRKKKKEKNEVSFGFPLVHVAISNSPCQRMMQPACVSVPYPTFRVKEIMIGWLEVMAKR